MVTTRAGPQEEAQDEPQDCAGYQPSPPDLGSGGGEMAGSGLSLC